MNYRPDLGFVESGQDLELPEFYAAAIQADGLAERLPVTAFRALRFSRLEDESIWTRQWVCIGSLADVPNAGDLLPFTVGEHGLHVQRLPDGGLVGRFNKAQHGGCRVVPQQCQGGTKTKCSFTSCGHSRDRPAIAAAELGAQAPVMHQYLGVRPERLLPVSVACWGPFIFVHLDAAPPALDTALGGLGALVTMPAAQAPEPLSQSWVEFPVNWKLLAQYLMSGQILDNQGSDWLRVRTLCSNRQAAVVNWVFPNLIFFEQAGQWAVVILQPTAIGKTLCRFSLYQVADLPMPHDGMAMQSHWLHEIGLRAAAAAAEFEQMLPPGAGAAKEAAQQTLVSAAGAWMQRALANKVLNRARRQVDAPLYNNRGI